MNIYLKLNEETTKNYKQFYEKLTMSLDYIYRKYFNYFKEKGVYKRSMLDSFSSDLTKIANLLDNYGYTYYPSNVDDVSENSFIVLVLRYLENFKNFTDISISNIETINTNIKTLLMLIDKHKLKNEHFN